MIATEFNAAQQTIGKTDEQLAAELGVTPHVVSAWRMGHVTVPRRYAQKITWLAAQAERDTALRASGLPVCEWIEQAEAAPVPTEIGALRKYIASIKEHTATCQVCRARERFLAERFGPMPPMPQSGLARFAALIMRLPPVARPAAVGAIALGGIVLLRVLFAIPFFVRSPAAMAAALLAIVAAAGAGASGGVAYSLTRPMLARRGRVGDYLTGIVCVSAYMASLALVAPVAFGDRIVKNGADVVIYGIVSVFLGFAFGRGMAKGRARD